MGDTGENPQLGQYNASNMCYASGDVKTSFATEEDIDSMKQMVAATDPGAVTEVGDAWHKIHQKLVVEDGSVKGDFDKAVEHILQHWEGESADEFAKKAKKVSKSIADCGTYAQYTAIAMHTAGRKLSEIKPEVMAIEKPGGFSKAMNSLGDGFSRDDKNWRGEISQNEGAQKALDNHHDDLSAGKEEQLKAAAKMEALAAVYSGQTKAMGSWEKRTRSNPGSEDDFPGEPGGIAPVPVPVGPGGSGPGGDSIVPAGRPVQGGSSKTGASTPPHGFRKAGTNTKTDGISGGTATQTNKAGTSSIPGTPGTGGASGGGGFSGSTAAGTTAGAGGTAAGGPGMVGQASGNRGMTGGGAGARGGATGGMRGGIGSGTGAGAGGKSGSAGAGRGPLARAKGGTLDTPGPGQGAARQGGSGLHSSRGGTESGQRGRTGMYGQGGAGANNGKRKGGDSEGGQRPDYLVEDEETWMPRRRDVTPPTIG